MPLLTTLFLATIAVTVPSRREHRVLSLLAVSLGAWLVNSVSGS
jgi:hypothetical protein